MIGGSGVRIARIRWGAETRTGEEPGEEPGEEKERR
jgi:hypothetical protein